MTDIQGAEPASPATTEPPRDGLLRAIRRTHATVDEETDALSKSIHADHGEFRHRKDLCLLDLSRRSPTSAHPHDPEVMAALRNLKDAIIRNQKALRCHINAARQVSAIIMKAIADEDSDRTYSAYPSRKDPRV